MKANRIYPYKKTEKEQYHYNLVQDAKSKSKKYGNLFYQKNNSKHQGGKSLHTLKSFCQSAS